MPTTPHERTSIFAAPGAVAFASKLFASHVTQTAEPKLIKIARLRGFASRSAIRSHRDAVGAIARQEKESINQQTAFRPAPEVKTRLSDPKPDGRACGTRAARPTLGRSSGGNGHC
jgi:hypothetical protein